MQNKKLKVGLLSVAALFALVACDEVVAKPTDYSEPLVVFKEDKDASKKIYNNVLSKVYDQIHDGGIGSEVLDKVLKTISESKLGSYTDLVKVSVAVATYDLPASKQIVDEFVENHVAYQAKDHEKGKTSDTEKQKILAKMETVTERIAEVMYGKISGGTYSTRNRFSEKKFMQALRADLKNVADPFTVETYENVLLRPEVEPKNVFIGNPTEGIDPFLHLSYYEDYIKEDVVPDIMKELLYEQYVFDEAYNTLGRSYARKVNIIAIKDSDEDAFAADYLMKNLVREISTPGLTVDLNRLRVYSNAYIGAFAKDSAEEALLEEINTIYGGFKHNTDYTGDEYYESTEYGNLVKQFHKIESNPNTTNSSIESDFTGNNTYSIVTGRAIKEDNINLKTNITTGWFVKNGGLSDLPDSIRSRLFNIGVANGVKENDSVKLNLDRITSDGSYKKPDGENSYVAVINGVNYLKVSSSVAGDDITNDILHYDSSTKTHYIIQIEEAVSSSKMNQDGKSENSYLHPGNHPEKFETIKNAVCKSVCEGESYASLATEFYLKELKMEYHDQSVYDYFKSTYPDLFE